MNLINGYHLPDEDKHFKLMSEAFFPVNGELFYQYSKFQMCLPYISIFRMALDIGAHVGMWSAYLANHFNEVTAFEPVGKLRELFYRNIRQPNVILRPIALGNRTGSCTLSYNPSNSGGTHISDTGDIEAMMTTLDSLEIPFVDFIKIDVEGYELEVLKGSEQTITRCKPVIICEQKGGEVENFGGKREEAILYLLSLGMTPRREMAGDYILSFENG